MRQAARLPVTGDGPRRAMEGPGTPRGIVRIEVGGFKSFADRVQLPLLDGVTAVIGPNGTGKSNLVDAIRWALGEQRPRPLRVERMEDLLYAGSERRRPAGMAECLLTLDNAGERLGLAGAEVEVARRLFRSGDSVYMVNRRPVRLRDVETLMRRAGVASDGYGIVSQGRVDEVLRARPAERLRMVEEAAGIGALEAERAGAVVALGEGAAERARLESRREELARRVDELARAAERAARDLQLGEEIRTLELALAGRERRRLERRREALAALVAQAQGERDDQAAQVLGLGRVVAALQAADGADALDVTALEAGGARLQESLRRLRADAEHARARAVDGERARRESEAAVEQARQRAARAFAQAAALAERLPALAAAAEEAALALARLGPEGGAADLGDVRRAAGERQAAARAAHEAATARAVELGRQREAAAAEAAAVEEDLARLGLEAEAAERAQAAAERALLEARQLWQEARERLLEGRAVRGQRAPQGAELVLAAAERGELRGVLGLLGDLIRPLKGLDVAIGAALGGSAVDIVTERAADAERAVAFLRQRGARATFLPLDVLVVREGRRPPDQAGVLGVAAELVRYEAPVALAVLHRLGGVWVVENLPLALDVGRRTGMRQRIVTLEGDVLAPGGAITGGAARPARLGRAPTDLGALQESAARAEAHLRVAEEAARRAAEGAARTGRARLERERAAGAVAARLALAREREMAAGAAVERAAAERGAAESALALLAPAERAEEAVTAATGTLARAHAAASALGEARGAMGAAEAEGRRAEAEAAALSLRVAALGPAPEGAEAERLERRAAALERNLAAVVVERERRLRLSAGRRRLETVARLGAERAGGALLALGERLEARERELAAAREALAEAEHRLVQAFGEGARAEAERAVATVTGEESTLTARLAALRQARGELGPVWAGAGEAHAEAARRLGAVDDELAGLEAARQALMALAEQARRRMDRAVAETLGAVRQGFVAAVAELLEGRGEVLEAGGDGAEAGLELRIALPGKRTAALAALSGGERALGALAFLFALLAVRPSALVLLDEVEAALDPANVGRFARHLRRTAATQQFLVITHQRATMEAAHALWGFTAQEAGASHLVTVRLDDAPAEEDTEGVAG